MNTNTRIRNSVVAALAAATLIAPLAGCAGERTGVSTSVEQRSLTDVAERRLALRESSRTDVAGRRLWMGTSASASSSSVDALAPTTVTPDVVERRQWMNASETGPIDLPDVAERRLWMGPRGRG
ncbi:hypothetical protein [Agromyces sp. M3QZ16-3]|uniref:hypothetical protein n=1 Tax=Agromyces sp. M3QZ16-3 TaxID=3447585 RepID=UPI003F6924FD